MIQIRNRLLPFCHSSGTKCLIPGTFTSVEGFPHLIRIHHPSGVEEISLGNDPFSRPFTLQLDLEKDLVLIQGKKISLSEKVEKKEKIFLGSNKVQDWDLILRRLDLREIVPLLFGLSQTVPLIPFFQTQEPLLPFFLSSFEHFLVPRESASLQRAFWLIRNLFFQEEEESFCFPKQTVFPSGRMVCVKTNMGRLDIEWAKWRLRRVVFHAETTGSIFWKVEARSFRSKEALHERGQTHPIDAPFAVTQGKMYFLDRFF